MFSSCLSHLYHQSHNESLGSCSSWKQSVWLFGRFVVNSPFCSYPLLCSIRTGVDQALCQDGSAGQPEALQISQCLALAITHPPIPKILTSIPETTTTVLVKLLPDRQPPCVLVVSFVFSHVLALRWCHSYTVHSSSQSLQIGGFWFRAMQSSVVVSGRVVLLVGHALMNW